jgi:hypothetical protein
VNMDEAGDAARRLGLVMDDSTRGALDALGDSAALLSQTWEHLWMNIGGAIAETPAVREGVEAVTEALGDLSKFVQDNSDEIQELVRLAVQPMAAALVKLLQGVQYMVSAFLQWKHAIQDLKDSMAGGWLEKAANALGMGGAPRLGPHGPINISGSAKAPETRTWTDPGQLKKAADDQAKAWEKTRKELQAYQDQLSKNGSIEIVKGMTIEIAKQAQEFNIVEESVDDLTAALLRAEEGAETSADKVLLLKLALEGAADGMDQASSILGDVDGLLDSMGVSAESMGRRLLTAFSQAAQGAADFAAGMASGNPAQMISGVIGVGQALFGFLGASSRAREETMRLANELRIARNEFVESAGGIDILKLRAEEAGISLHAMLNARDAASFEAAVRGINDAFELQDDAIQKTREAMEKWGLSAADMGPKFAQGMFHEQLLAIHQDFLLLTAAGADAARVLGDPSDPSSMASAMNALVAQSQAAGVALPESMRPMIEKMIELGLLVDGTGQQITDVSQIAFTETLEAGVARLVTQIERLVNALLGIPQSVNTQVNVRTNYTENGPGGGGGGGHFQPPDLEPDFSAAEGFYSPALPEDAFFQLHKGERVEVTPADETPRRNARDQGGSSMQPHFHIQIGPREIRDFIVREMGAGFLKAGS